MIDGLLNRARTLLIAEWRGSWKLWSVQANAVGLGLMSFGELIRESWVQLPEHLVHQLPHAETIGILLFLIGLVSRLLKQVKS